jgi:rhodanese-related sulfurtransferase
MGCNSACSTSSSHHQPEPKGFGHIDTEGLAILIASGASLVLLDARNAKWDDGKRIGVAQLLSSNATAQEVTRAIPSKQSLVIVYCTGPQCPASSDLGKHLQKLGYHNILKYTEGIEGWIKAGHPTHHSHA